MILLALVWQRWRTITNVLQKYLFIRTDLLRFVSTVATHMLMYVHRHTHCTVYTLRKLWSININTFIHFTHYVPVHNKLKPNCIICQIIIIDIEYVCRSLYSTTTAALWQSYCCDCITKTERNANGRTQHECKNFYVHISAAGKKIEPLH